MPYFKPREFNDGSNNQKAQAKAPLYRKLLNYAFCIFLTLNACSGSLNSNSQNFRTQAGGTAKRSSINPSQAREAGLSGIDNFETIQGENYHLERYSTHFGLEQKVKLSGKLNVLGTLVLLLTQYCKPSNNEEPIALQNPPPNSSGIGHLPNLSKNDVKALKKFLEHLIAICNRNSYPNSQPLSVQINFYAQDGQQVVEVTTAESNDPLNSTKFEDRVRLLEVRQKINDLIEALSKASDETLQQQVSKIITELIKAIEVIQSLLSGQSVRKEDLAKAQSLQALADHVRSMIKQGYSDQEIVKSTCDHFNFPRPDAEAFIKALSLSVTDGDAAK